MAKPPRSLVLGTAGHIDHGKTTLVRALTGRDTDRLPEEKRRGITIELGFAAWPIAPGLEASIVDVPGHEGFVRTMVAGAGGIDAVILVVSAEEGVMPQTREHVNICRLLGVKAGVVALTNVDRLEGDTEAIELATEDVRGSLADTVFAEAPIVPCSGKTGEGVDGLRAAIRKLVTTLPRRDAQGDAILPVDRAFTMKGHGTVITGTLLRGTLETSGGQALRLVTVGPGREPVDIRSRGIQVRGSSADRVRAGSRVALNLAGIEVADVHRGDVVTDGDAAQRTSVVHAHVHHLPSDDQVWTRDTVLQVCAGTAHSVGRLDPLWREDASSSDDMTIPPNTEGIVRIRLETPVPSWRGQRLILRRFSTPDATVASADQGHTTGGGTIIDPAPTAGRAQRRRWVAVGRALMGDEPLHRLLALVGDAGTAGIGLAELGRRAGVDDPATVLASQLGKGGDLVALSADRYVQRAVVVPLVDQVIAAVDRFHAAQPLQPGLSRAAVEGALPPGVAADVAAHAVALAKQRGALRDVGEHGDLLARPGKGLQASSALPERMQTVLDLYTKAGTTPPTLKEVAAACELGSRQALDLVAALQRTGKLIKVTADLSLARDSHDDLVQRVRKRLDDAGEIDVQALKQMTGLSRKYAVPFLEHLDQLQITLRKGDTRIRGPKG